MKNESRVINIKEYNIWGLEVYILKCSHNLLHLVKVYGIRNIFNYWNDSTLQNINSIKKPRS